MTQTVIAKLVRLVVVVAVAAGSRQCSASRLWQCSCDSASGWGLRATWVVYLLTRRPAFCTKRCVAPTYRRTPYTVAHSAHHSRENATRSCGVQYCGHSVQGCCVMGESATQVCMTRNGRTVPRCMTAAQCQRGFTGPPPAGDSHLQASIPEPVEATRWKLPSTIYALTQPLLALATAGMATLFSGPQPGARAPRKRPLQ